MDLAQAPTTADRVSPYDRWGGLPATVASLEDFDVKDPSMAPMFAKLDRLENAARTMTGLTTAMKECESTHRCWTACGAR